MAHPVVHFEVSGSDLDKLQSFYSELFGWKTQKVPGVAPAGDDHDVLNSRVHQRLDRVINHRTVIDRQQVFVGDLGEREQSAACSSGENDTFHKQIT